MQASEFSKCQRPSKQRLKIYNQKHVTNILHWKEEKDMKRREEELRYEGDQVFRDELGTLSGESGTRETVMTLRQS